MAFKTLIFLYFSKASTKVLYHLIDDLTSQSRKQDYES
jgi:hypothetical protein